ILFFAADDKRKTIRLGKVSQRQAESVRVHIEHLISARITRGSVPDETASWLAGIEVKMRRKLTRAGLIQDRAVAAVEAPMLAAFIDAYIAERIDVKPGTKEIYQQIRRNLVEFFGEGKRLSDITPGDA